MKPIAAIALTPFMMLSLVPGALAGAVAIARDPEK